ncbi:histidine kinase N-terminal 7TM domain-containing diguanylate cyclase [Desulfofarcimen acetoxidans]|nr:diguanylate cyclase [Desulfofarcimen acetoxidans]
MASAMFTFFVFIYMFKQNNYITKYFAFFCLSITIYSFGYSMELYGNRFDKMLFWNYIQYLGLPFLPALWLIFSLEYNNKRTKTAIKAGIFLIPILTLFFRYTSNLNHLFYVSVQKTTNLFFPVLYIVKGPWYWVHAIYTTSCFIVVNYVYFFTYRKSTGSIRRQCLLLLIASLFPWISYLLDLLNISPLNIDWGAFAVTSSVAIFLVAYLRYQFLNIKPLARDKVFESTNDGIIVLDANNNVIDFNPSAEVIFPGLDENCIGKNIRMVFETNERLVDSILNCVEFQYESLSDYKKNYYRVQTVKILESRDRGVGFLITFNDITKYMNMMEELNHLASRDALTGVYNRRYFAELSSLELSKSRRYNMPASLIILDLDFFKQINDNYGHQAGDTVLKEIADICRKSIRSIDILGRYGGEEFVIFLPNTKLEDCRMVSNRILNNIASAVICYEGKSIKVTASIGTSGVEFVSDENLDHFLKTADQALYQAKLDGRNCLRSSGG